MLKKNKERRDTRVYVSITSDLAIKLDKLAYATHFPKSTLAYLACEYVFSSQQLFDQVYRLINKRHVTPLQRGLGHKRVHHLYISITPSIRSNLQKMSRVIGIPVATIPYYILEYALNSPAFINTLQQTYNRMPERLILPIIENGKVSYVPRS
jgi:hypothetical protein